MPLSRVSLQLQVNKGAALRVPHPEEIRSRAQMARARKVRTRGEASRFLSDLRQKLGNCLCTPTLNFTALAIIPTEGF